MLLLVEFREEVGEVGAGFLWVLLKINYLAVNSFSSFLIPSDFSVDVVLDQVVADLLIEDDVTKMIIPFLNNHLD